MNASALSDEARRLVLERVKRKLGFERTLKALGIARGSLYNYIHGYRSIPDGVVEKARNTWGNTSSTRWCRVSIGPRLLALYGEVTAWTTPLY